MQIINNSPIFYLPLHIPYNIVKFVHGFQVSISDWNRSHSCCIFVSSIAKNFQIGISLY